MEVKVTIGAVSVDYIIQQTRAPSDYDGFGTFTLQNGLPDDARLVCIRKEHFSWQYGRYCSGVGYTPSDPPAGIDVKDIEDALWRRLWKGKNGDS